MEENNKINAEDLENISGGMIFNAAGYEGDPFRPYEVVANHNCQVLAAFSTKAEACEYAKRFGKNDSYNTMEVDWLTVQRLRNNPNTN
ncbi:MAG: hypothetical protein K6G03_12195 [Lachnospiraceae bacterium]|nr:hypothetical protein [Lachnospiraceae bacterium]